MPAPAAKIAIDDLGFAYGDKMVLSHISFPLAERAVTALIRPSGCGKSTLLRCLNRLNDTHPGARYGGRALLHPDNLDILAPGTDPLTVRRRVGMVFQKPNPFPQSIFDNVAYGLRLRDERRSLAGKVEAALRRAALWDEVSDRLRHSALELSGGQQQRLCIARALAVEPDVLLLDEPTSALDPQATLRIESLIRDLAQHVSVLIVTHNMHQARRVCHHAAFLYKGELVEYGPARDIFTTPRDERTRGYIAGQFG
ncbi:MAG: phosphate ABC transporter ATP-binding protein [Alphaproteobacteria bacterium]|nr:MAG: phosphate ABC transporter ATP-binding protein [Alphaproteobacteria bacterium]